MSRFRVKNNLSVGIIGLVLFIVMPYASFSQSRMISYPNSEFSFINDKGNSGSINLNWHPLAFDQFTEEIRKYFLFFTGCQYGETSSELPVYIKRIKLNTNTTGFKTEIINPVYQQLSNEERNQLKDLLNIGTEIEANSIINYHKKIPYGLVSFIPIRKNKLTGAYEKLISFDLKTSFEENHVNKKKAQAPQQFASNSVLATGDWYKLSLSQNGVYKITYTMMKNMGIDVDLINPQNIRIFGNGGGMLPKLNSTARPDDLLENAIQVVGEIDGSFDSGDYILFYGESPHQWSYNSSDGRYHHQIHDYSNYNYYFLTTTGGTGIPKRISAQTSLLTENTTVTSFDDYVFHEFELYNLIISGRQWFGEHFFDNTRSFNFSFSFPNISDAVYLKVSLAGRVLSPSNGSFTVKANGSSLTGLNLNFGNVGNGNYLNPIAKMTTDETVFSSGSTVDLDIIFNNTESSSEG